MRKSLSFLCVFISWWCSRTGQELKNRDVEKRQLVPLAGKEEKVQTEEVFANAHRSLTSHKRKFCTRMLAGVWESGKLWCEAAAELKVQCYLRCPITDKGNNGWRPPFTCRSSQRGQVRLNLGPSWGKIVAVRWCPGLCWAAWHRRWDWGRGGERVIVCVVCESQEDDANFSKREEKKCSTMMTETFLAATTCLLPLAMQHWVN